MSMGWRKLALGWSVFCLASQHHPQEPLLPLFKFSMYLLSVDVCTCLRGGSLPGLPRTPPARNMSFSSSIGWSMLALGGSACVQPLITSLNSCPPPAHPPPDPTTHTLCRRVSMKCIWLRHATLQCLPRSPPAWTCHLHLSMDRAIPALGRSFFLQHIEAILNRCPPPPPPNPHHSGLVGMSLMDLFTIGASKHGGPQILPFDLLPLWILIDQILSSGGCLI